MTSRFCSAGDQYWYAAGSHEELAKRTRLLSSLGLRESIRCLQFIKTHKLTWGQYILIRNTLLAGDIRDGVIYSHELQKDLSDAQFRTKGFEAYAKHRCCLGIGAIRGLDHRVNERSNAPRVGTTGMPWLVNRSSIFLATFLFSWYISFGVRGFCRSLSCLGCRLVWTEGTRFLSHLALSPVPAQSYSAQIVIRLL